MTLSIDSALGLQERALEVLDRRMQLISGNLANADTPGFKARDLDFRSALDSAASASGGGLLRTHGRHLDVAPGDSGGSLGGDIRYRTATQPSLDGNTVDTHQEKTAFAEAAVRYESTLTFLGRRISGLRAVLTER